MAQAIKVLAALNDQIEIDVPTDQTVQPLVHVSTGFAGTLVVEGMINGVGDYVALPLTPLVATTPTVVSSIVSSSGLWTAPVGAYDKVRARISVAGAGGKVGLSVAPY
jgi:hypothetical protein